MFNTAVYIGKRGVEPGALFPYPPYKGFFWSNMMKAHHTTVDDGIEYLAEDDQCTYEWVPSSGGVRVENGISFDHGNVVYLARTDLGSNTRIGKVGTWVPNNVLHYAYGPEERYSANYDVLTCVPKPRTTTTTTTVAPVIVPTTTVPSVIVPTTTTSKPETTTKPQTAIYD
jgi:hypothetical protein